MSACLSHAWQQRSPIKLFNIQQVAGRPGWRGCTLHAPTKPSDRSVSGSLYFNAQCILKSMLNPPWARSSVSSTPLAWPAWNQIAVRGHERALMSTKLPASLCEPRSHHTSQCLEQKYLVQDHPPSIGCWTAFLGVCYLKSHRAHADAGGLACCACRGGTCCLLCIGYTLLVFLPLGGSLYPQQRLHGLQLPVQSEIPISVMQPRNTNVRINARSHCAGDIPNLEYLRGRRRYRCELLVSMDGIIDQWSTARLCRVYGIERARCKSAHSANPRLSQRRVCRWPA
jgi:hypothetical protein